MVIASAIFHLIRGVSFNTMSECIGKNIRYDLFFYMINKDVHFFDENMTGELLSRIASDTEVIHGGLSTTVSMFVRSIFFIVGTIIVMMFISWKLTLVLVGGMTPMLLMIICYGQMIRSLQKIMQT